jgi:arylsulfatase A-like enzyme
VDWYPTLLKLAGATLDQALPLDGRDAWPTIARGEPSPHAEIPPKVGSEGARLSVSTHLGRKRPVNPIFKTVCRREMMFGAPS